MPGAPADNSESDSTKGKRRLRGILIAVFLGLPVVLVAAFLPFVGSVDNAEPAPLVSSAFLDGTVVEVCDVVAATSLRMEGKKKPPWSLVSRTRGFTYTYDALNFVVRMRNGGLESVELSGETPSLMMLLRLRANSGEEILPDHAYFFSAPHVAKVRRDSEGVFETFEAVKGERVMEELEYRAFVEDGAGGWLPMAGPVAILESDGRSFLVAHVFPRHQKELKLRVERAASESLELQIPNPGYQAAPAGWTVDPKPWEVKLSELIVRTDGVKLPQGSSVALPTFEKEMLGSRGKGEVQVQLSAIEDEWGNIAYPIQFRVLPGTDKLRFHAEAKPSHLFYRWRPEQVLIVADGVWSGSGTLNFTIAAEGKRMGLESVTMAPPPSGSKAWELAFSGEGDTARIPKRFVAVIFEEGEPLKAGSTSCNGSWRFSVGGSQASYTGRAGWEGRIQKGTNIQVGFVPDTPPESFFMTLPLESTP